jgi:1-acyl-sn-glycerol-3-phosphate acyltransferase
MAAYEIPEGEALHTEMTATYRICRAVSQLILKVRYRMQVQGLENIPKNGPALIVANHQSYFDIPLIAASTKRHVCFVARSTLAHSNLLGFIMRECGAVLIDRGKGDRAAMRSMVEHLNRGDVVAIFPEGTRSEDGRVGQFKGGALLAARKAGAPIVPVAIRGSHGVWPRWRKYPGSGRIGLRYLGARPADGKGALEAVHAEISAAVGDGTLPQ